MLQKSRRPRALRACSVIVPLIYDRDACLSMILQRSIVHLPHTHYGWSRRTTATGTTLVSRRTGTSFAMTTLVLLGELTSTPQNYLLAEIIKGAFPNPNELLIFVVQKGIQPAWDEIPLPPGQCPLALVTIDSIPAPRLRRSQSILRHCSGLIPCRTVAQLVQSRIRPTSGFGDAVPPGSSDANAYERLSAASQKGI